MARKPCEANIAFDAPTGVKDASDYDEEVSKKHPGQPSSTGTGFILKVGERVLYVSPSFLKSIPDLSPAESEHVMQMLWEHAVLPEFTVRFRWQPGSIAFWDNRATAHLAPRDIFATGV